VDDYGPAMPSHAAPHSLERLTVYVDGFNLYHGLKERAGRRLLWLDLVKITQGRYQKKLRSCRACGATWTQYEEKETDVNIATTLVADTATRATDSALILSADSDLAPAVRTARSLNGSMFLAAAFPPMRYSAELSNLMPASFNIGTSKLNRSQLPQTVVDPASGRTYTRPQKWN
jgi:hypothetical protein